MKRTINFSKLILFSLIIFTFAACKKKEDNGPANEITDASGLRIDLTWNTGGTSAQAQTECDLDIFLFNPTTSTDLYSGTESSYFENFTIKPSDPDGEYTIKVKFYSGDKNTNFDLKAQGTSSSNAKSYTISGNFPSTTADRYTVNFAKLKKSGNKYIITKL